MNEMVLQLYEIGAIRFGRFTLKSGIESPFYIDLRLTISYPSLLEALSEALWKKTHALTFDRLCGVPYTALPIASYLSIKYRTPMVIRRKEAKSYGTKNSIEGVFNQGDRCLVIEDLVTSGSSVIETADMLKAAGMEVTDAVAFLDRQQGGDLNLARQGYNLHALITLTEMFNILCQNRRIDEATKQSILAFAKKNALGHVPK